MNGTLSTSGLVTGNGSGGTRPLVLVVAESLWGHIEKVTFELLAEARRLAPALAGSVEIVLLASPANGDGALRELQPIVQERVHLVEHPLLEDYSTSVWVRALETLLAGLRPSLVMLGATANGRDLGPRLAARLGMGYLPHCLLIKAGATGRLDITRVSHGGRVHLQLGWPIETPLIITMRPGVADAASIRESRGDLMVERHAMELQPGGVRVVKRVPADPRTQDIREAERVVSAGRGVGGPEGFAVVHEFADALNAAVGASRVAVDLGWIEHARQVGQTGRTVAPRLYVAVGISGASHHLMGMRGSEKIVAINVDRQAPIFAVSHFGAVGDLHQVLPRLTERLRQDKAQGAARAGGGVQA